MAGFRDLFALVLGWKSAGVVAGPYRVAAGCVWHSGAEAGGVQAAGAQAGGIYVAGQQAGRVHG